MKPSVFIHPEDATALRPMAPLSSNNTLPCCLSKPRSNLEAGKKQHRVWLEYAYSMTKMLLYSSFGAPLVFLWSSFGIIGDTRYMHGGYTEVSRRRHVSSKKVSQRCNEDMMVMLRRLDENLTRMFVSGNVCSLTYDVGFNDR